VQTEVETKPKKKQIFLMLDQQSL